MFASILSKRQTDDKYTYGYKRAEIVAGLLNASLLICIAMQIIWHALVRLVSAVFIMNFIIGTVTFYVVPLEQNNCFMLTFHF